MVQKRKRFQHSDYPMEKKLSCKHISLVEPIFGKRRHIKFTYGNELFSFLAFLLLTFFFVRQTKVRAMVWNYAPNVKPYKTSTTTKSQPNDNQGWKPLKWKLTTWHAGYYEMVPVFVWIYFFIHLWLNMCVRRLMTMSMDNDKYDNNE